MVLFGQSSCRQVESGCIRAKVIVFRLSCCIRAKVVVFGQSGCFRAKVVFFRAKVVVFGHTSYSVKMVGCRQKRL